MIGVYGGTFDPVHYGHLRTALEMKEIFALEAMRMMPAAQPALRGQPGASSEQRLQMLQIAINGLAGFIADDRELRRSGPSYMVDTLASLRAEIGVTPLLLFVGADAFAKLERWRRWQNLTDYAHIVVMTRPGSAAPKPPPLLAERLTADREQLKNQTCGYILLQNVTQLEISATHIRKLLAAHRDARFLLPDAVLEFILAHHLYQNS